ncbi:SirB2 family protein [Lysobacter sp. GX 14042]|uniref:SirB2 family protein n=1 Tax=Lysobacter sp. GX 14042 TaxID=2907155 RepID=UPI001F1C8034|nr:SirB2 family protein [Lysobacter sp. GX 14042]MCE7033115.1 SirB2 family protein [Lysobacter sp. GX 14042]
MIEFYPQIKHAHIALALLSGTVFAIRGLSAIAGMRWPHWTAVRITSYIIDTGLLTAALMLLSILPGAFFANGWLTTKLVLLVVYVGLGVFAMRRGRPRAVRIGCYIGALAVFGFVYTIARAHHPLGILYGALG